MCCFEGALSTLTVAPARFVDAFDNMVGVLVDALDDMVGVLDEL